MLVTVANVRTRDFALPGGRVPVKVRTGQEGRQQQQHVGFLTTSDETTMRRRWKVPFLLYKINATNACHCRSVSVRLGTVRQKLHISIESRNSSLRIKICWSANSLPIDESGDVGVVVALSHLFVVLVDGPKLPSGSY